jgi:hypothetical protein
MATAALIDQLDVSLPGFRAYLESGDNFFENNNAHGVFAACSHFVRNYPPTEQSWRAMATLINSIVGSADADLDEAACTCFLENLACIDHPLRSLLNDKAAAYWQQCV